MAGWLRPLWVISGHCDRLARCPLYAESGQSAGIEGNVCLRVYASAPQVSPKKLACVRKIQSHIYRHD